MDRDKYKEIIELHNKFAKAIKKVELEFTNSYYESSPKYFLLLGIKD